jgi:response regulator RpfG family c-di-GMP phosphodiesterase
MIPNFTEESSQSQKVKTVVSRFQFTSFENSSILRKMTILYFLMSIVPVGVLYYLYLQLKEHNRITIRVDDLNLTLILVVIGVGVGYFAMRSFVMKIVDITRHNREALDEILGADRIQSLISGNNNEISILAKSFNEITSRLEENVRNLELAKKTLHSVLARVGEGISSMENIDNFLKLIVETVTEALQAEVGMLWLTDESRKQLLLKAVHGKSFDEKKAVSIPYKESIFQLVIDAKQPMVLDKIPREGRLSAFLKAPVLCAPLLLHDDVLGVIAVSGRRSEQVYDEEEKVLLFNLALQTAVAIENSKLSEDAEKTYFETISALALAVEAKDPYSRGHLDRVAKFVVKIAEAMNLNSEEIQILRDAAKLHDLGKIGVTDDVLKKEGKLTAQEMDMMKKHCEIGEGIIKPIRSLRNLCDLVRHHHEKLDGSGYPDGLKGEEILPLVRILSVADIYDALTSNRPYRQPFTKEKAFEVLRSMKDQLDQKIVEVFVQTLQ